MNLEMAATDEMLKIATKILPEDCCLVPEKRQELTTEGGLDVISQIGRMKEVCSELSANNIKTSLFIDADNNQIEAAVECGAPIIEIHTGHYADASSDSEMHKELVKISNACSYAHSLGLQVNAGHGLTLENTKAIAEINTVIELNIGHSIISRALFVGLSAATSEMKQLIQEARGL
jgi:pyridoxine 5-phosphate synthase